MCRYSGEVAAQRMTEEAVDLLSVVLRLLRDEIENPKVVVEVLYALGNLCRFKDNAMRVGEVSLELVVRACQLHGDGKNAATQIYKFCHNLCVHPEVAPAVIKTNAVQSLLDLMQKFREEPHLIIAACDALEAIAFGDAKTRVYMNSLDTEEAMLAVKEEFKLDDQVCIAATQVISALHKQEEAIQVAFVPLYSAEIDTRRKEKKTEVKEVTLAPSVRNNLTGGALLKKHSKKAEPRMRQVFVTPDLQYFIWKDPRKPIKPENKMKIVRMENITIGNTTDQLRRTSMFGKPLARDDCSFSIHGRDSDRETRTVDLETTTPAERDKWVADLKALMKYTSHIMKKRAQFEH